MNRIMLTSMYGVHTIVSPHHIAIVIPDPDGRGTRTAYITGVCILRGQPDWSIHPTFGHTGKLATSSYFRPWGDYDESEDANLVGFEATRW